MLSSRGAEQIRTVDGGFADRIDGHSDDRLEHQFSRHGSETIRELADRDTCLLGPASAIQCGESTKKGAEVERQRGYVQCDACWTLDGLCAEHNARVVQ